MLRLILLHRHLACMQELRDELAGVQQQLVRAVEDLERERASFQQTSHAKADQVSTPLLYTQILHLCVRHSAKLQLSAAV